MAQPLPCLAPPANERCSNELPLPLALSLLPLQAWEMISTTLKKSGVTFVTPAQVPCLAAAEAFTAADAAADAAACSLSLSLLCSWCRPTRSLPRSLPRRRPPPPPRALPSSMCGLTQSTKRVGEAKSALLVCLAALQECALRLAGQESGGWAQDVRTSAGGAPRADRSLAVTASSPRAVGHIPGATSCSYFQAISGGWVGVASRRVCLAHLAQTDAAHLRSPEARLGRAPLAPRLLPPPSNQPRRPAAP